MATATLKTIALATGFSVTTVSRALGGFDDVSEETRQIILEEARRQGYRPNSHARALQTRRTQTIGLIAPFTGPRFPDPFFGEFVAGAGNAAGASGYDLLLSTQLPAADELEDYQRLVLGRRVDGLLIIRARYDDARVRYLTDLRFPFVVFGRTACVQDYVSIDVDGATGQRELTEHFIRLGHRRIAYFLPPRELMFTHFRLQGFHEAMAHHGLPVDPDLLIETELTENGGREAAHYVLGLPHPPTAIMTGNDRVALGVMGAIHSKGLVVGRDIAVAGFDDIPAAEHVHPGLTTVRQPIYEIGQRCAQTLLHLIAGEDVQPRSTLIKPELVVRASSGSSL